MEKNLEFLCVGRFQEDLEHRRWKKMGRNVEKFKKKKEGIPLVLEKNLGFPCLQRKIWNFCEEKFGIFLISGRSTEVLATEHWRKMGRNLKNKLKFPHFWRKIWNFPIPGGSEQMLRTGEAEKLGKNGKKMRKIMKNYNF